MLSRIAICFIPGLFSLALSSAVLPAQLLEEKVQPVSPNNRTTMERLFRRDISCSFNSALSQTCDKTAYCCWKFIAGPDTYGGGFCCPDTQLQGGACCGNTCCPYQHYCAWADSLGHYSCIPDASTGSGYPTMTSTSTFTVVQTTTVTQFGTNTQIQVQTQAHTETVVQTSITTTTLGAKQTVTVISVPVSAAPAESSIAASSSNSDSSSTPTGAIVGGVVGGLALIVIAGLFIFTGIRRSWFERRDSQLPVVIAPVPGSMGWRLRELPTTANQRPLHEVDAAPAPVEHYGQYRD